MKISKYSNKLLQRKRLFIEVHIKNLAFPRFFRKQGITRIVQLAIYSTWTWKTTVAAKLYIFKSLLHLKRSLEHRVFPWYHNFAVTIVRNKEKRNATRESSLNSIKARVFTERRMSILFKKKIENWNDRVHTLYTQSTSCDQINRWSDFRATTRTNRTKRYPRNWIKTSSDNWD